MCQRTNQQINNTVQKVGIDSLSDNVHLDSKFTSYQTRIMVDVSLENTHYTNNMRSTVFEI